jgi:hypothetical protein
MGTVTFSAIENAECSFYVLDSRRQLAYPPPMSRSSRIVIAGVAHHVTQRGNGRMRTFFGDGDYVAYRAWVAEGCRAANVEVLAYCLMPNHVHFILVPPTSDGLRKRWPVRIGATPASSTAVSGGKAIYGRPRSDLSGAEMRDCPG